MNLDQHILIVEDELIIAHSIKEMLHELGFKKISLANTQTKAELLLNENNITLALLDINLGKGDEGIQLSKLAKKLGISFLFVTSYTDKNTLDKALQNTPAAYVNKPVLQHSLYAAVRIALNQNAENEVETLKLREGTKIFNIPIKEVLFVHAENNYIKVVTTEKNFLIRMTLSGFMKEANRKEFIQIHRSYLVNLKKIDSLEANQLQIGLHKLPISRSYKEVIRQLLAN